MEAQTAAPDWTLPSLLLDKVTELTLLCSFIRPSERILDWSVYKALSGRQVPLLQMRLIGVCDVSEVQIKKRRVNNRPAQGWDCDLAGAKSLSREERSRQGRKRDWAGTLGSQRAARNHPPGLRALRDRRNARGYRYTRRMRIAAPAHSTPPLGGPQNLLWAHAHTWRAEVGRASGKISGKKVRGRGAGVRKCACAGVGQAVRGISASLSFCCIPLPIAMAAYKLVLIRHGESAWNLENRFSGWYDADLSPAGHEEAKRGGQALRGTSRTRCGVRGPARAHPSPRAPRGVHLGWPPQLSLHLGR